MTQLLPVTALALAGVAMIGAQPHAQTFADVPGARIWYTDTGGAGAPVVFLHAATGTSAGWEHQTPAFTKAGYRAIAYDRRGFGRTLVEPTGPQPGTGADDLRALMDRLGIARVHLVATAAGGAVAFDYALSFPDRVRALVVANSIGGVQDEDYLALGQRLRPPEFAKLPPELRELSASYRAVNAEGTRRWIELERSSRPEGSAPIVQGTKTRVTFAQLETLKVPTLLLTGDADMYTPPAVLRLFIVRIRHAQSTIVQDAGHAIFWEQPEVFNRVVLEFLRRH